MWKKSTRVPENLNSFKQVLLAEHSKTNVTKTTNYIGADPEKFATLIYVLVNGTQTEQQRASWVLSYSLELAPHLLNPYWTTLLNLLKDSKRHPSIRRNILRHLQILNNYPTQHISVLLDLCLQFIRNPKEPRAVKAFALTVLYKISLLYPELTPEIKAHVSELLKNDSSPAVIVRARLFR